MSRPRHLNYEVQTGLYQAVDWTNRMADKVRVAADRAIRRMCEDAARAARQEIWENRIRPISKKRVTNPKLITLLDTASYVGAIQARTSRTGGWYVGVPQEGVHPPSGVNWVQLWKWLRFGTARMPARVHIDRAVKKVFKRAPEYFAKEGLAVRVRGKAPSASAGGLPVSGDDL